MNAIEQDIQDIASFADPYTEPKLKRKSATSKVEMIRGGRTTILELDHATQRVVEVGGRKRAYSSVTSLLASEQYSNLTQLAGTQLRAMSARHVRNRIPASVRCDNITGELPEVVEDAILRAPETDKTKLLLIDGPAGIGKTFQIEQLVTSQATKVTRGEATPPVLHVTSKGRRLSNLRDVLAAATQELAASFFANQVPSLVRRGLLIVAIDGFDELVDADGYEDSWLALRQFIADVGRGGALVLAARDTFVDEQELLERVERSRSDVELIRGEVLCPTVSQVKTWLRGSPSWKPAELDSQVTNDILRDGSYALRPFFLRELWQSKGWSEVVDAGPRTYLVNRLLSREANLIAQQVGGTSAAKVTPALVLLLKEVAMEMTARESDSIEVEHLSFLTQYCFDGVVNEDAIRKLMHKSGSLALLELTTAKGARKFPHSEVQHFFLGHSLLDSLADSRAPSLLRRHVLNCTELDAFGEVFSNTEHKLNAATRFCSNLLASEVSSDSLASNLAAILTLMLALNRIDRLDFANVLEASLGGLSPKGTISSSRFARLDACGADMSELNFQSVGVDTLIVDESTVFGRSIPEISQLEIRTLGSEKVLRSRKDIEAWISKRARLNVETENPAIRFLEKVARRSVRHFYLRLSGDEDAGSALLNDPMWDTVSKILQKYDRLEVHRARPMHGRPSPLIRVKNPMALLDHADKDTAKILSDLTTAYKKQL